MTYPSTMADSRSTADPPRLRVERVGFRASGSWLVRSVTFEVRPGEIVALAGANGAGKSTLLRLAAGFLLPTEGSVLLDGQPTASYSSRERARLVANVPQSTAVEGDLLVEDLVLLGRHPHLGRFAVEGERDRAIARLAMRSTDTEWLAGRTVATLSGGERQRVLIARALAQEPRLLLLDEPTASLDLRQEVQVLELVRRLADAGLAVVAAIHDLRLAARYASRLIVLRDGEVIADAPPSEALSPTILATAFGVRAAIDTDPISGLPEARLLPIVGRPAPRGRVHVIAGGGRGAPVLARLTEAGFDLTVGPLGEGDTDLPAARLSGARVLVHRPFAPIDDEADAAHRQWVREADVVVVVDACWGPANLRSLAAAEDARRLILLAGEPIERRDFTGGGAAAIAQRLAGETVPLAELVRTIVEEPR
ncbi:MAG: ABC transporter ATP-binding protein [Dehalococcoidia bacterium]